MKNIFERMPSILKCEELWSTYFSEKDSLELLTKVFEKYQTSDFENKKNRCHINGKEMKNLIGLEILPSKEENIEEYIYRIKKDNSIDEICFVSHDWHKSSENVFYKVEHFLSNLIKEIGVSGSITSTDLFAGTYRKTPHGIHKDTSSVFIFPTYGKKRMAVWPYEYFKNKKDSSFYQKESISEKLEDHLKNAQILEANVGEVIYIPHSYWHIAVNESNAITSTLNISLNTFATSDEYFNSVLKNVVKNNDYIFGMSKTYEFENNCTLDKVILDHDYKNLLKEIENNLKLVKLKKISSLGLDNVPFLSPTENFIDNNVYYLNVTYPLFFIYDQEFSYIISRGAVIKNLNSNLTTALSEILNNKDGVTLKSFEIFTEIECVELFKHLIYKKVLISKDELILKRRILSEMQLELSARSASLLKLSCDINYIDQKKIYKESEEIIDQLLGYL